MEAAATVSGLSAAMHHYIPRSILTYHHAPHHALVPKITSLRQAHGHRPKGETRCRDDSPTAGTLSILHLVEFVQRADSLQKIISESFFEICSLNSSSYRRRVRLSGQL